MELEAAREVDARVVLASSAAVYGEPEPVPIGGDTRKAPPSPYGLEKLAADRYARLYHGLCGTETVSLVLQRPRAAAVRRPVQRRQ